MCRGVPFCCPLPFLPPGLDLEWTITGEPIVACVAPGETVNFVWEGPWHNVVDLGEDMQAWEDCAISEDQMEAVEGPWSTTLPNEGMFHYVCGVLAHCSEGMQKAMITVSADCP